MAGFCHFDSVRTLYDRVGQPSYFFHADEYGLYPTVLFTRVAKNDTYDWIMKQVEVDSQNYLRFFNGLYLLLNYFRMETVTQTLLMERLLF